MKIAVQMDPMPGINIKGDSIKHGMTLDEIANATGTGRETVKSRLRYALNKLRRLLADPASAEEVSA